MQDEKLHYIVITGIIIRNHKYLITQRSKKEAAFPGLWTVPGGKLRKSDYINSPKDTSDHWYHILENLLKREIKEEVNLEIENICYLLSLSYIRSDNVPTVILSFYCDYKSGKVRLSDELIDYKWVEARELKNYKFVPGLHEEIELVDKRLKGKKKLSWKGKYDSNLNKSVRDG